MTIALVTVLLLLIDLDQAIAIEAHTPGILSGNHGATPTNGAGHPATVEAKVVYVIRVGVIEKGEIDLGLAVGRHGDEGESEIQTDDGDIAAVAVVAGVAAEVIAARVVGVGVHRLESATMILRQPHHHHLGKRSRLRILPPTNTVKKRGLVQVLRLQAPINHGRAENEATVEVA